MNDSVHKSEFVNCVVDGRSLKVKRGENLLEAARRHGLNVPGFCHHPNLSPSESCGLCEVEIRGIDKPVAACSFVIEEEVSVRSRSDDLDARRHTRVGELYRDHPADCPRCDLNGDCSIQDLYLDHGGEGQDNEFTDDSAPPGSRQPEPLGPSVALHAPRCVGCELCVRFSDEIAGDSALRLDPKTGCVELASDTPLNGNYSLNTVDL